MGMKHRNDQRGASAATLVARLSVSASCAALCVAMPAAAQQTPAAQTAAAPNTAHGLETIVVTARRRSESLQKVPIAVSVISGAQLERKGISNGQDLSRVVPALTTVQLTRDEEGYTLRGLTNVGASIFGSENNVQLYFSQVPFPTGDGGGPGRDFDLSNIQVLKGPQGTLFGRNSTGGAVLIEPHLPTDYFDGYLSAQGGNYNDQAYEGMINIPLIRDQLLLRVAAKDEQRDGFTTNIYNGQKLDNRNYTSVRASLEWTPNDSFSNLFTFDSLYSDTAGTSLEMVAANPGFRVISLGSNLQPTGGACFVGVTLGGQVIGSIGGNPEAGPIPGCSAPFSIPIFPNPALPGALALQQRLGPREVDSNLDSIDKTWSWGITDIAAYNITPDVTVKNIFGFRTYQNLSRFDQDGSAVDILQQIQPTGWTTNTAQVTDEVNVNAKLFNNALDLTAGNFYLTSHPGGDSEILSHFVVYDANQFIRPDESSEAAYAQGVYDLGTIASWLTNVKFTAGFRYTWDHRSLRETEYKIGEGGGCSLGTPPACEIDVGGHYQSPTWTFALDYQVTPSTLLYVTTRRGYQSGGLNTIVAVASQVPYEPEVVKDVEIGVKNDWQLDGVRGRTDVALYHENIDNAQITQAYVDTFGTPIALVTNQATGKVDGAEVDETVVLPFGLTLTPAWDYTDARYTHYIQLVTNGSLLGLPVAVNGDQPFPYTPLNRFSFTASYQLPVPERWGGISVSGTEYFSGHVLLGAEEFPGDEQKSYHQLDLHLNWTGMFGKPIDFSVFATNVYNSVYKIGGYPILTNLGFASETYNEPQMFGVRLKYRFGAGAG